MHDRLTRITLLALLVLVAGCADARPSPTDFFDGIAANAPIRMDRDRYDLTLKGAWYEATLNYSYENRTGAPVYIVNCGGSFGLRLDRWDNGRWVTAWSPVIPDCLSAPIIIEADEVREFTLPIYGAPPGTSNAPTFDTSDPGGWYRLVWTDALSSFDATNYPFGAKIPKAHRVSAPFRLRAR